MEVPIEPALELECDIGSSQELDVAERGQNWVKKQKNKEDCGNNKTQAEDHK